MQNVDYYKNNFGGKPSYIYSVTKTMKFITTFDKKNLLATIHAQDTIESLNTNLSGISLAIAIVL